MQRPALLIIDLFSRFDFPDGQTLAPLALKAAKKVRQIQDVFDEKQWPVIYANDNFGDWKCGFHQLAEVCRHEEGPSGDIAKLLFPGPDHYTVLKPKHSAFLATPLAVLLAKIGVDQLVLVGMALDSCVLADLLLGGPGPYRKHQVSRRIDRGQCDPLAFLLSCRGPHGLGECLRQQLADGFGRGDAGSLGLPAKRFMDGCWNQDLGQALGFAEACHQKRACGLDGAAFGSLGA